MRTLRIFLSIACLLLGTAFLFACRQTTEPTQPAATEQPVIIEVTPQPVETVGLYGQTVLADVEALVLSEPVDDLRPLSEALARFPECRSVQLTRRFDPAFCEGGLTAFEREWADLTARYPLVAFTDTLLIGGEPSETLNAYTVPADAPLADEIRTAAALFPALNTLDLTETTATCEAVAAAERDVPGVRIVWTDAVYGASDSEAETLAFSGAQDPAALETYLACFPALSEVDLTETTLSDEQMNAISDRFPEVVFHRIVLLNGTELDNFAEELDLSGAQIESYEAFSDALRYFPSLKRLVMHDCSLTNEQLAAIRDRYPDVKVVWTVYMKANKKDWSVKTDATAFSTLQYGYNTNRLHSDEAQVLQYCTDLIALDLGHNDITDLEWMRPLENLQVLILGDNQHLKDIEVIGTLKKLKYVELFMTGVEDITPLANLDELLDINLCYTKITDPTPLLSCKKLERIWLGIRMVERIKNKGVAMLLDAFPNAEFDLVSEGSTGRGWRMHPRYDALYSMFHGGEPVEPFLP